MRGDGFISERWRWPCAMLGDGVNSGVGRQDKTMGQTDAGRMRSGGASASDPHAWALLMEMVPYLNDCNVGPPT